MPVPDQDPAEHRSQHPRSDADGPDVAAWAIAEAGDETFWAESRPPG